MATLPVTTHCVPASTIKCTYKPIIFHGREERGETPWK